MPISYPLSIAILVSLGFVVISFWPVFTGANWEPTPMKRVRKMLKMANVSKKDFVFDVGFGDGRIIFTAINEFKAKAGGIEIEPIKFIAVKLYSILKKLTPDLKLGSVYNTDFSKATVITIFMSSATNKIIQEKFSKLKKGTKIVSYYWKFPDWKIIKQDKDLQLYLYEIGKS